jgi:hypothetical protein
MGRSSVFVVSLDIVSITSVSLESNVSDVELHEKKCSCDSICCLQCGHNLLIGVSCRPGCPLTGSHSCISCVFVFLWLGGRM